MWLTPNPVSPEQFDDSSGIQFPVSNFRKALSLAQVGREQAYLTGMIERSDGALPETEPSSA